jgi:hypothetical protein
VELLSVQRARSVWLFDLGEVNPRGKSIGEDLLQWLADAYHFSKVPSSPTDLDESKALAFLGGSFQIREEVFIDVELRVYNDGFVGDTRSSTEDTDKFLEDVLQTFSKEFSLPVRPDLIRKKLYHSELNVKTDKSLSFLNLRLTNFAKELAEFIGVQPAAVEPAGITFWADFLGNPQSSDFRFERKLGIAFEMQRYWSKAPVQTSQHLKLLNTLEAILAVPPGA